jgi:hypothetical protein
MEKYFVLFGNDRYHPEDHYKACKHKFDLLKDARAYARDFYNAYVFRMYDNGTVAEMRL